MGGHRLAPARPALSADAPAHERQLPHLPTLDGLRGLAILLVMCDRFRFIDHPSSIGQKLFLFATGFGWMGVQLFFVLSGYLITRILLETRSAPNYYGAFFARRVLRIFPLYYTVLLVACVLVPLARSESLSSIEFPAHQLWSWTYLQNWTEPFGRIVPFFPHFWSLGVEEQFYLLWPAVIRFVGPARLPRLCFALMGIACAARCGIRFLDAPWSADACYMFTVCRMDALAMGALVAVLAYLPNVEGFLKQHTRAIVAAGVGLFFGVAAVTHAYDRTGLAGQTLGYSVLAFEFALVLWLALEASAPPSPWLARVLGATPLASIGKYSYAMYVLHAPLHEFVGRPLLSRLGMDSGAGAAANLAYLVAATFVTYVAGIISYHLLERHFLRMKKYFIAKSPTAESFAFARS